jgi:glycosyltransferase involved in cell wall biosynthesis
MGRQPRVMMIGPSRKTRGGISAVLKTYEASAFWKEWDCHWLETHIDRSLLHKFLYAIKAYAAYSIQVHRYRIIHIHFSEPPSAARKTFFFIPARLLGKKVILHFHSFSPETTTRSRFAPLYRFLFDRADAVIVLSETWKRTVGEITRNKAIHIVNNPSPIRAHAADMEGISPTRTILFAGTLNARKGFRDLIRAFAMVRDAGPGWTLVLAGNGEIEEGRRLANELGVADQVSFAGWVDGAEKERLFRQASIFCLPSYAEGFPMAVIDAITYGIPVVTTPVGGILDVLEAEKDILVFEPGDIATLAGQLKRLIDSGELRNNLSRHALDNIKDSFDMKAIGARLGTIYRDLLPNNH